MVGWFYYTTTTPHSVTHLCVTVDKVHGLTVQPFGIGRLFCTQVNGIAYAP